MSTEHLEISQVSIEFPTDNGPFKALDNVNLKIKQGEFVSLIGHSGCGKSTVLNIVAGLYQATTGGVILDGKEVNEPGPDRAVVFQNHSLLPWLTAYENVELAVKQVFKGKKTKREIADWIEHNLELVHMGHAMHKRPDEISGGMKQRVGIARALSMEPKVLLMDEPFGALDALTRTHMQDSLMEIQERLGNTVIMITHDVDEAVLLSDRIVMMTNGPEATIGAILDVELERPRDRLALAEQPDYNHYRAEVVRFLHERHHSPSLTVVEDDDVDAGEGDRLGKPLTGEEETPVGKSNVLDLNEYADMRERGSGTSLEKTDLNIGFIPLSDCAPLVVAQELGLFQKHGLNVTLSREPSWATIRDKVSYGLLDAAQMLAAMPLATTLQANGPAMVTGLSLSLNGNAITVSNYLYEELVASGLPDLHTALGSARGLKKVIEARQQEGREKLTFAMVFPESSHNYLLRYWMSSVGIDPDRDVKLVVVPPAQMVENLRAGSISGYCVGEPWNAYAVVAGAGHTLVTTSSIWQNHPEKVLGVTEEWAETHPNTLCALHVALLEACAWLQKTENRQTVCEWLSDERYVNLPVDVIRSSMVGGLQFGSEPEQKGRLDSIVFHRYAANYPWRSHGLWALAQMARWGQIKEPQDFHKVAARVYRPDLYRRAAAKVGLPLVSSESKVEGLHDEVWYHREGELGIEMGPDRFMDGEVFDSEKLGDYLARVGAAHLCLPAETRREKDERSGRDEHLKSGSRSQ